MSAEVEQVRGTFRRDLEPRLARGRHGSLRLPRRWSARVATGLLAAVSLAAGVADLALGQPWVAALQLALCAAFLWLLLRAELESWAFEGEALVFRRFSARKLRMEELQLPARELEKISVLRVGRRARAWVETKGGERYALVEGREAEVALLAQELGNLLALAAVRRRGGELLN